MSWDGSILGGGDTAPAAPDLLADLNLDQVFTASSIGGHEAARRPLRDRAEVIARQEVFRDLEAEGIRAAFDAFDAGMRSVRKHLEHGRRLHQPRQRDRWEVDAQLVYCRTLREMRAALRELPVRSSGLRRWGEWLADHVDGDRFQELDSAAGQVRSALDAVRYTVHVTGRQVVIDRYDGRSDYGSAVAEAFARFRPGGDPVGSGPGEPWPDMNEVEEQVIAAVAQQFPAEFRQLERHAARYREFLDPVVARFAADLRFYLNYLGFVRALAEHGLPYCYPEVTDGFAGISADSAYDAALACTLIRQRKTVVCNDFRFDDAERVLVVTGPNQGGKSTFARTVGQLVYLGALGCPVPAARARIMLPDNLFTHFVREDDLADPSGALAQELTRLHDILTRVTDRSVVVLNESLSTTTAADAARIGREVVRRLVERGAVAVYVTFVEELAALGPEVVSMVAGVESGDDPVRTFTLVRRPPDGLAYTAVLARRHGLTYTAIRERLR
ncbi:MutS-related protein [Nocardia huaxiensis]|uniref:DNA mismatch repair protein MutS n=1 Tax=Nocardia huaxiensis TaxID=2755382 RepID=A0A7D6V716_9NOCA|nr:DNA mismatch repair protein MutS [Nocardia huaxiensis]QLY27991.1 DNA mismatch repair protein MutS [Nocardia huaxiensis]UFS98605.1 DNA mismatch repair protein MutS [Nocardia huaxiensis]